MKPLLIVLLVAGMLFLVTGCATPAYSGGVPTIKFPAERASGENANNIVRGWYLDSRTLVEDINSTLLLGEPSELTKWNVR